MDWVGVGTGGLDLDLGQVMVVDLAERSARAVDQSVGRMMEVVDVVVDMVDSDLAVGLR